MADLYGPDTEASSPSQPEEISAFFSQFLRGSSSASSSSCVQFRPLYDQSLSSPPSQPPPPRDTVSGFFEVDGFRRTVGSELVSRNGVGSSVSGADLSSFSGFDVTDHGAYFGSSVKEMTENATSSAVDPSCDSENRSGASEMLSNSVRPRSSSKRCRAAEVHNMSEKRRRNRINERLKALQKLIPNSNKTDKASMLDEAIEYLKQLQLQVQMLVMRNGVSLYPVCLPGVVNPMQLCRTSPHDGYGQLHSLPRSDPQYDIAVTLGTQLGFEPESHANYGSFGLRTSSEKETSQDNKQLQRNRLKPEG